MVIKTEMKVITIFQERKQFSVYNSLTQKSFEVFFFRDFLFFFFRDFHAKFTFKSKHDKSQKIDKYC